MKEICRELGVSEPTFTRWRKQFAGMGTVEVRRLKQLDRPSAPEAILSRTPMPAAPPGAAGSAAALGIMLN